MRSRGLHLANARLVLRSHVHVPLMPFAAASAVLLCGTLALADEPAPPTETRVSAPPGSSGLTVVAPASDGQGGLTAIGCSAVVVTGRATEVKPDPERSSGEACGDPVLVHFRAAAPNDETWWTVRGAGGSFLCRVPCSAWVPPKSHLSVQRENAAMPEMYPVPDDLPVPAGGEIDVVVDHMRALGTFGKLLALPVMITFGIGGPAMIGFGIADAVDPHRHESHTQVSTSVSVDGTSVANRQSNASPGVTIGVGIGLTALAALSTIWFVRAHDGGLTLSAPSERAPSGTAALRPRFHPTFGLTTTGIGGTF